MIVWAQLLILIVTNLPGLLSSLKEIFELFGGDRRKAKFAMAEIKATKGRGGRREKIKAIIDKYANQ